jgi:hypothetical protein
MLSRLTQRTPFNRTGTQPLPERRIPTTLPEAGARGQHSIVPNGGAPKESAASTTRSQLLQDAHTVINNTTTVHGYSPRLLTDARRGEGRSTL